MGVGQLFESHYREVGAVPLSRIMKHQQMNADGARAQRGFVLIEMMLAVGIVGTAMLATVLAFSTASRTSDFVESATKGEWIATSQIELIKTATYVVTPGVYPSVTAPAGFAVSNFTSNVTGGDSNIQIVTVTVSEGGEPVYTTSALKVNR